MFALLTEGDFPIFVLQSALQHIEKDQKVFVFIERETQMNIYMQVIVLTSKGSFQK